MFRKNLFLFGPLGVTGALIISPTYQSIVLAPQHGFQSPSDHIREDGFAGWWRLVFGVSSAVLLITATFFMVMGSGSIQDWNAPGDCEPELEVVEEPSRLESVLE